MAHHLVTQVDEVPSVDSDTVVTVGHLTPTAGERHALRQRRRSSSTHGHKMPQGCWRTFMSYFRMTAATDAQAGTKQSIALTAASSSSSSSSHSPVPRPIHSTPFQKALLTPQKPTWNTRERKCLVLDLDESLVHSSFKPIPDPSFVLDIELDGVTHKVFVRKRPGVDYFLKYVAKSFEVVIFTASLAKYADPLLDILDTEKVISARLFRESCVQHYGNYVKDLTHLGRPLAHTVILDNSPFSYLFQPTHAIPCTSWFQDQSDLQLYELLPFLDLIAHTHDVEPTIAEGKAAFKYTFFGPVHQAPKIVVPWEDNQQMQQLQATTTNDSEADGEQRGETGNEIIQVSVGS